MRDKAMKDADIIAGAMRKEDEYKIGGYNRDNADLVMRNTANKEYISGTHMFDKGTSMMNRDYHATAVGVEMGVRGYESKVNETIRSPSNRSGDMKLRYEISNELNSGSATMKNSTFMRKRRLPRRY